MPNYKTKYGTFRVTINDDIFTNQMTRIHTRRGQLLENYF